MATIDMKRQLAPADQLSMLRVAAAASVAWGIAALGAHLASAAFGEPLVRFGARLVVIWLCGALFWRIAGFVSARAAHFVGIAWAAAAIGTELYLAAHGIAGWYELLGTPGSDPDWTRALTAAAWLLAPRLAAED